MDDKTHARAKDQLRDARLEQGRIRTVRFQERSKPGVETIRATILGLAPAEETKVPKEVVNQGTVVADKKEVVQK